MNHFLKFLTIHSKIMGFEVRFLIMKEPPSPEVIPHNKWKHLYSSSYPLPLQSFRYLLDLAGQYKPLTWTRLTGRDQIPQDCCHSKLDEFSHHGPTGWDSFRLCNLKTVVHRLSFTSVTFTHTRIVRPSKGTKPFSE